MSSLFEMVDGTSASPQNIEVDSTDPLASTVTLKNPLPAGFVKDKCGLIIDVGGINDCDSGIIWIGDVGQPEPNDDAYKVYLAHEIGHDNNVFGPEPTGGPGGEPGGWIDVAPDKSLMFGGNYSGGGILPIELRFRSLPDYYEKKPDQSQWDSVRGR